MHGAAILPTPRTDPVDPLPAACRQRGRVRRRYSIAKFQAFIHYQDRASNWRILYVLALVPFPGLLGALISALIPLQSPSAGVIANSGAHLRLAITLCNSMIGASLHARSVTGVLHHNYTTLEIIVSSLVGLVPLMAVEVALGLYWRYPVPLMWVMLACPWFVCLVIGHCVVMRRRLLSTDLQPLLVAYVPSFVIQTSQIIIYPAISVAFGSMNDWQQVILAIGFPALKYCMKVSVRKLAGTESDSSEAVAVSTIEVPASMYQAMIMQNSQSLIATAVIIGVDVLHGIIGVLYFMNHQSCVPQVELIPQATDLLSHSSELPPMTDGALDVFATKYQIPFKRPPSSKSAFISVAPLTQFTSRQPTDRSMSVATVVGPMSRGSQDASNRFQIVTHALEVMQSAEHILLVEYLEVAIPIVNTVFLVVASQLDSAKYNPKLYPLHQNNSQLVSALSALSLYILLQGMSVIGMSMAMWYHYRLSAMVHLAFVLERHYVATQGLMYSWLGILLHFSFVHYGTTFDSQWDIKPVI